MLEEKIEALTSEVVALRKAIEAGGLGGGSEEAAAGGAKGGGGKGGAKSGGKAKAKPKHDKDEVAAIMRQAAKEVSKPKVQEYIGEQDCADLAELLTKPELFDAAYEFAEGLIGDSGESEEDEDI